MKVRLAALGILCVFTFSLFAQSAAPMPSLYKRLGGYDALAAVTDDFIGRLATDKQLGRFFVGHSEDSLKKIRQPSSTSSARRPAGRASTSGAT